MFGWYVFDKYGDLYCGAEDMNQALQIAARTGGKAVFITDGKKHDKITLQTIYFDR